MPQVRLKWQDIFLMLINKDKSLNHKDLPTLCPTAVNNRTTGNNSYVTPWFEIMTTCKVEGIFLYLKLVFKNWD